MYNTGTREQILEVARKLFNKKGVENVTSRDLAAVVGISQGNLHYHYPAKENILEALFELFEEGLAKKQVNRSGEFFTKEMMFESLLMNFRLMHEYRFLFINRDDVWRRSKVIQKRIKEIINKKRGELHSIIQLYIELEVFRKDFTKAQLDCLADQMILIITSWITSGVFFEEKNQTVFFATFVFRSWLPYMKPSVMKTWESYLESQRKSRQ
jgi:AcrR family transcriptional regulator